MRQGDGENRAIWALQTWCYCSVKQGVEAGERRGKGRGGTAVQGSDAVNGEEKGIIRCEVMRLGRGFKKVKTEKGGMLLQDQYM